MVHACRLVPWCIGSFSSSAATTTIPRSTTKGLQRTWYCTKKHFRYPEHYSSNKNKTCFNGNLYVSFLPQDLAPRQPSCFNKAMRAPTSAPWEPMEIMLYVMSSVSRIRKAAISDQSMGGCAYLSEERNRWSIVEMNGMQSQQTAVRLDIFITSLFSIFRSKAQTTMIFPNSWKLGVFSHSKGFGAGRGTLPQDSLRFPTGFPTTGFPKQGSQNRVPKTGFPKQGSQQGSQQQGSQQQGSKNRVPNRVPSKVPNTVPNRVPNRVTNTVFKHTGFSNNVPTTFPTGFSNRVFQAKQHHS